MTKVTRRKCVCDVCKIGREMLSDLHVYVGEKLQYITYTRNM